MADLGGEPRMHRWAEQRWVLDNVIRANGVEWDQGRLSRLVGAIGSEILPEVAAIRQRVQKFADITPAFEAAARRREAKAMAAEEAGALVTARENYFIAASYWASAQWTILQNNEHNLFLNRRKRECYSNYARLAERRVEEASIPFRDKSLAGWLHLPANYAGDRIPAIINITGMDGFKEATIALYGDRYLNQGCAVLTVEGPGQYEAAIAGIYMSVPAWAEAGTAITDWLVQRPEIDPDRIGIVGRSFGSFFSTIAFANEPRLRACAVTGTVLQPGCHALFEEASPTFKRRFMYMAGILDEREFDEFAKSITWAGHAEKIRQPYLCVTGEFDQLSPLEHTERLFEVLRAPKTLVIYQGADHTVSGVPSTALGPYSPALMSEWMAARMAGKPLTSERCYVDSTGRVNKTAYG